MTPPFIERDAARILLIDPAGHVLLQEVEASDFGGSIWIAPGGGLEPGETNHLRELVQGHIPKEPIDVGV